MIKPPERAQVREAVELAMCLGWQAAGRDLQVMLSERPPPSSLPVLPVDEAAGEALLGEMWAAGRWDEAIEDVVDAMLATRTAQVIPFPRGGRRVTDSAAPPAR